MKLTAVRVQNYKSIDDSGWVEMADVTCMVGKNESGKTAFLQALAKLNPAEGQVGDFDMTIEFPRMRLNSYKREHEDDPADAVSACFELEDKDIGELPAILADALTGRTITVTKRFDNSTSWDVPLDEAKVRPPGARPGARRGPRRPASEPPDRE